MNRRPLILAGCGLVIIIVGLVVLAIGRDQSPAASAASPPSEVPVLVANEDLPANAKGADIAATGKASVQTVSTSQLASGALTDLSQLDGRQVKTPISKGAQITAADLSRPPLRSASVVVPKETEAVAVSTPFTAGGAGYFAPGDHVNVLAIIDDPNAAGTTGSTKLVIESVEVLDVSTEVPPRVASQSASASSTSSTGSTTTTAPSSQSSLTYLLAIPRDQVEKVVQAAAFHKVYLSLPADDASPRRSGAASDADLQKGQS